VIWSWASFAVGYVVGGFSALLLLGLFAVGGRADRVENEEPPQRPNRSVVVDMNSSKGSRRVNGDGPHSQSPSDRSA
jgi:hypothetical protein